MKMPTLILFQRGATSWGFQIHRFYWYINYPRFWFLRGRSMDGSRRATFGSCGIQEHQTTAEETP